MKLLLLIPLLFLCLPLNAEDRWLEPTTAINFKDSGEPFEVLVSPDPVCFAGKECYHEVEIFSIERPADKKTITVTRNGPDANATVVTNPCSNIESIGFTLNLPRTGLWYSTIKTCFADTNECSDPIESRNSSNSFVNCAAGGWLMYKYPGKPTIEF